MLSSVTLRDLRDHPRSGPIDIGRFYATFRPMRFRDCWSWRRIYWKKGRPSLWMNHGLRIDDQALDAYERLQHTASGFMNRIHEDFKIWIVAAALVAVRQD